MEEEGLMKEEAYSSIIDLKNYDLPCKLSHIPFSYKSPALEEASHISDSVIIKFQELLFLKRRLYLLCMDWPNLETK